MDKAHKITDEMLENMEKEIEAIYNDALKNLKVDYNKLISKIDTSKPPIEIFNQLQQKKRLEALMKKMTLILNNSNKVAIEILNDNLIDIYSLNYNWGAFTVERETLIDVDYSLYNREAVKKILKEEVNPFTLMAIDDLTDKANIYKRLKRTLTSSLLQGDSMQEIAKKIKGITNKNYSDSIRIARTETTRVENAGRLDSFKHAEKKGLKLKKRWISTVDTKTRKSHKRLQGETVGLDEKFSNGLDHPCGEGKASEVINCRCSMTTEFEGLKKGTKEKELDKQIRKMSFEEWQDEKKKK